MSKHTSDVSAPWHMWVLGVLLLLWQGLASFDYIATLIRFEPYLAQVPEDALAYYFNAPIWMYVMWGVGSVGGLIGVILLLMRNKAAVPIFGAALVCSMVAAIYSVVNPAPGGGGHAFLVGVIAIALLILLYFVWLRKRGVLR